MTVQLAVRPDEHTHVCTARCVPCGRTGCNHCQNLHREQGDECLARSCDCMEFAVGDVCPDCAGIPGERHVMGLGLVETRCSTCNNDGVI